MSSQLIIFILNPKMSHILYFAKSEIIFAPNSLKIEMFGVMIKYINFLKCDENSNLDNSSRRTILPLIFKIICSIFFKEEIYPFRYATLISWAVVSGTKARHPRKYSTYFLWRWTFFSWLFFHPVSLSFLADVHWLCLSLFMILDSEYLFGMISMNIYGIDHIYTLPWNLMISIFCFQISKRNELLRPISFSTSS